MKRIFKKGDLVKFSGDLNLKDRGTGIVVHTDGDAAKVFWTKSNGFNHISHWVGMEWLQELK